MSRQKLGGFLARRMANRNGTGATNSGRDADPGVRRDGRDGDAAGLGDLTQRALDLGPVTK